MSMSKGYKSSKMSDSRLKKISLKLIDTSSYWSNSETSWLLWPTGWMREMRLSSTCKRSWTLMTRYIKRLRWTLNLSLTEFKSLKNSSVRMECRYLRSMMRSHTHLNEWVSRNVINPRTTSHSRWVRLKYLIDCYQLMRRFKSYKLLFSSNEYIWIQEVLQYLRQLMLEESNSTLRNRRMNIWLKRRWSLVKFLRMTYLMLLRTWLRSLASISKMGTWNS